MTGCAIKVLHMKTNKDGGDVQAGLGGWCVLRTRWQYLPTLRGIERPGSPFLTKISAVCCDRTPLLMFSVSFQQFGAEANNHFIFTQ